MSTRGLRILLGDERYERIAAAARQRGVSVATVVRDAIDRGLPQPEQRRRTALRHLLDAPDMPVPDVAELRTELETLRSRRR